MPFPINLKSSSAEAQPATVRHEEAATGDLYFPAPPNAVTASPDSRRGSESHTSQPPPAYRPRKESSPRHVVGYGSQSRRRRLEEPTLPAINLSPRHWILTSLLLLAFLILIMGFIFADCVTLPHRDKQNLANNDDAALDTTPLALDSLSSIYIRQTIPRPDENELDKSTASLREIADNFNVTLPSDHDSTSSESGADAFSSADEVAKEIKRLGFTTPRNLAILFFYTATLPLLTVLHTLTELVMLWCGKHRSSPTATTKTPSTSDSEPDSTTNLKPLSLAKKHSFTLPSRHSASNSKVTPYLPALSLATSILLILGWITTNAIQIHCEIRVPDGSDPAAITAQMMCPVQLRGHFMYGIHELSVARNVVGWIIVLGYITYAVWCLRLRRSEKKEQLAMSVVSVGVDKSEDNQGEIKKESRLQGKEFDV